MDLARLAVREYGNRRNVKVVGSVGPYATKLCDGSEYTGDYVEYITEQVILSNSSNSQAVIVFAEMLSSITCMYTGKLA